MNGGFEIKGWCPGALRPMASGDGLIVRVRPRLGRMTPAQARTIAACATRHGNGLIDLTSRANLQIRGVAAETYPPLMAALADAGLVDPDPLGGERRNVIVAPLGDGAMRSQTLAIASALERLIEHGPALPAKFGFVVDAGAWRVLADASGDVRIERDCDGRLIVRADGAQFGRRVSSPWEAAQCAAAMAAWFADGSRRGVTRGRMSQRLRDGPSLPANLTGDAKPAPHGAAPRPGLAAEGALVGAEFGALDGPTLAALADLGKELRLTPWRMVLVAGASTLPHGDKLVVDADDARLRTSACSGAPACPQAHASTRALARSLAGMVPNGAHLHVSGCAKGCAKRTPSTSVLIATGSGFSLVRAGTTKSQPSLTGLTEGAIRANPSLIFEAC